MVWYRGETVKIKAEIGTSIRLDEAQLPPDLVEEIIVALSVPNQERINARKEKLEGWMDMPEYINLWHHDALGRLVLPRGFQIPLVRGLRDAGVVIDWDDDRADVPMDPEFAAQMRVPQGSAYDEHQEAAVRALIAHETMIYKAPPGSGKTITILKTIQRLKQRAIILVDKANMAEQWLDRLRDQFGVEGGMIGDGVWDPGEITVALKQSLWSARHRLKDSGFFNEWGIVAYDECHHVTAETYQFVVQQFNARYLFGVSATPKRVPWTFPIAKALLGPVVHETTREELREKGILVEPKIRVVPTEFEFKFRGTKVNSAGYRVGNNYQQLQKKIIEDPRRNALIIGQIMRHPEQAQLVVGKRIKHFEILERMLHDRGYENEILRLTGKESRAKRKAIQAYADDNPCVIFSTIADEGVDIPNLGVVHLIWPTRNISVVRQQIGRVERAKLGKTAAIVYDYYDARVGVLRSQFNERFAGVYRDEELFIEDLTDGTWIPRPGTGRTTQKEDGSASSAATLRPTFSPPLAIDPRSVEATSTPRTSRG